MKILVMFFLLSSQQALSSPYDIVPHNSNIYKDLKGIGLKYGCQLDNIKSTRKDKDLLRLEFAEDLLGCYKKVLNYSMSPSKKGSVDANEMSRLSELYRSFSSEIRLSKN